MPIDARLVRSAAALLLAAPVLIGAQSPAPKADPWQPFLGCWSTSSEGVGGPMVCVVRGDVDARAEFLTVDGDSVTGRSVVDASGTPRAQVRGDCVGFEEARFSDDAKRLYMHADYRCANGTKQRADAIVAMTYGDAFSHVEGVLSPTGTRTHIVNFIVQLDTTVYPAEVKRRLHSLRALARGDDELGAKIAATSSEVMDAAEFIDAAVVRAWLDDRGEHTELSLRDLQALHVASSAGTATRPLVVPSAMARTFLNAGYRNVSSSWQRVEPYRGDAYPTNILVTPAMVNFGGSASGFPSDNFRGVAFRWP